MVKIKAPVLRLVAVVVAADRNHRRRIGRRDGGVPLCVPAVAGRGHDHYASADCRLGRPVNNTLRARDVFVPAERDVEDAYVGTLPVLYAPLDAARDILLRDAAALARLDENEAGGRREAAIK